MKRPPTDGSDAGELPPDHGEGAGRIKKSRIAGGGQEVEEDEDEPAELGEDLVLEVLKRADDRTLGAAACVSRRWRRLTEDERLWEAVCTRHWANMGCGKQQLRAVVLALGGFRRLHSLYLLPLLAPSLRRPAPAAAPIAAPFPPLPLPAMRRPNASARWSKDEVQLSLSLLSIGYFEKMDPNFRPGGSSGGGSGGCSGGGASSGAGCV